VIALEHRRLVRALTNGGEHERWEAAKALSAVRDEGTIRKVEHVLRRNSEEKARAAAAYVLGFAGDSGVAPVLSGILADRDESVAVRAYAAEALGHLLQHEPVLAEVRLAIRAGLGDPAAEIRFWSAFAAGVLELHETRGMLERLAGTDHAEVEGWWSVAEEATWALRVLDGEEDPPLPSHSA
jgi:HEAT repeat protein